MAQGRTLVGVNESDTDFNTVWKTGGEKTHKLTVNEMPKHSHTLSRLLGGNGGIAGDGGTVQRGYIGSSSANLASLYSSNYSINEIGGDTAHNNMQPYLTVYMWKRVA